MLTDDELNRVRHWSGLYSLDRWRMLYRFELGREVSREEVLDAHSRLMALYWAEHPAEKAEHDKAVEEFARLQPTTETFWRGDRR